MTITALAPRSCELRESDHKYVWLPTGEEMAVSVTGVISHGKPPVTCGGQWTNKSPYISVMEHMVVLRNGTKDKTQNRNTNLNLQGITHPYKMS